MTTRTNPTPAPPAPASVPLSTAAIELMAELMRPAPPTSEPELQAWDRMMAAARESDTVVYSTFDGEPPDEWPVDHRPSAGRVWMLAATLAAAVAAFIGLFRWRPR